MEEINESFFIFIFMDITIHTLFPNSWFIYLVWSPVVLNSTDVV